MDQQLPSLALPSNRKFGAFLSAVLALLALYASHVGTSILAIALLAGTSLAAICAVVSPAILAPLNKGWYVFGVMVGSFMHPVVLGVLYFLFVTPLALAARLLGHDPLRLTRRGTSPSYWIIRGQPSIGAESFRDQF